MQCFVETIPSGINVDAALSVNTHFTNIAGLLALEINAVTTRDGFQIDGQTQMAVAVFPSLASLPATAPFNFQSNAALTTISAPKLMTILTPTVIIGANPSLVVIDFPLLTAMQGLNATFNTTLQSLSFPALATVGVGWSIGSNLALKTLSLPALVSMTGNISANGNPLLDTIVLTALQTTTGSLNFNTAVSLVSVSHPALVSSGSWSFAGCTLLASLSAPNWSPTNAKNVTMTGCALNQASVDHILARAVANPGYVSGTLNLSGGTSASPSAAGLADKAALIARGCTVTTN